VRTHKQTADSAYVGRVPLPFLPVQLQSTQQTHKHEVKRLAPEQPLQLMIGVQQLQPLIRGLVTHLTQTPSLNQPKLSQGRKIPPHNRRRQPASVLELRLPDALARRPQNLNHSVEFPPVPAFPRTVAPLSHTAWSLCISMTNIIMVVSRLRILQNQQEKRYRIICLHRRGNLKSEDLKSTVNAALVKNPHEAHSRYLLDKSLSGRCRSPAKHTVERRPRWRHQPFERLNHSLTRLPNHLLRLQVTLLNEGGKTIQTINNRSRRLLPNMDSSMDHVLHVTQPSRLVPKRLQKFY